MGITDRLKNASKDLLRSALGEPKKAFLVIHRQESFDLRKTNSAKSIDVIAAKALLLRDEADMSGEAISKNFDGGDKVHVMQVQYNPKSIDFLANSEPIPMSKLQRNVVSDIPAQYMRPPSVSMSVELVFDAMNVKDSFMADKAAVSGSLGGVVTNTSALLRRNQDQVYSVRPQTNALLAAVLRQTTNHVTFYWSGMTFNGIVMQAQARYTMFSVSGQPVRSVVKFVIEQKMGESDDLYWVEAFDKCFGDANEGGDYGGQSAGQYVGNLLNLG
jgi:hypothetical protein